jgi:putative heme iron utilization protein
MNKDQFKAKIEKSLFEIVNAYFAKRIAIFRQVEEHYGGK